MGAWGHQPFENDGAGDLEAELAHAEPGNLSVLESAFDAALAAADEDGYIEVDQGEAVIAAAALLARLKASAEVDVAERLHDWLAAAQAQDHSRLAPKAREALDKVMSGGDTSEIVELWHDTDEFDAWLGSVQTIRAALS
ncbi:MAG: DUF4259 domain-containing protein [Pseudomonadota bacterium]|nr:DUF4259 domain-containing protein [Pseudomonadota bacterium]